MKKDKEKIEMFDEAIDYEVYADSPKTIITVPWDPKREERELESYRKFLALMKKIEEEKKLNIKVELEPLNSIGPVLKKVKKH